MGLIYKIRSKFCIFSWGIGIGRGAIEDVIRKKKLDINFTWLPLKNKHQFIADPFFIVEEKDKIHLLYEDFSIEKDGIISLQTLNTDFKPVFEKELLRMNNHLSYPYVFKENGITYIIPESHQLGKTIAYQFDFTTLSLTNEKVLMNNLQLLDTTILEHNNKYWLFATLGDKVNDNGKLYIYYADTLFGNYTPHKKNPVKTSLDGCRPAGDFIKVDGEIYRPSQNCADYYGKSITIQKIIRLNEHEFKEEAYFDIEPIANSEFCAGLHTINASNDIIVIDGIRLVFSPLTKMKLFFKKLLGK